MPTSLEELETGAQMWNTTESSYWTYDSNTPPTAASSEGDDTISYVFLTVGLISAVTLIVVSGFTIIRKKGFRLKHFRRGTPDGCTPTPGLATVTNDFAFIGIDANSPTARRGPGGSDKTNCTGTTIAVLDEIPLRLSKYSKNSALKKPSVLCRKTQSMYLEMEINQQMKSRVRSVNPVTASRSACMSPCLGFPSNKLQSETLAYSNIPHSLVPPYMRLGKSEDLRLSSGGVYGQMFNHGDNPSATMQSILTSHSTGSSDSGFCGDSCATLYHGSEVQWIPDVDMEKCLSEDGGRGTFQPGCSEDALELYVKKWRVMSGDHIGKCYCNGVFSMATLDGKGGKLHTKGNEVLMTVPPGALETPTTLYFAVMYDEPDTDEIGGTVSPSFECGPDGTVFKVPVTLHFHHCYDGSGVGDLRYTSRPSSGTSQWQAQPIDKLTLVDEKRAVLKFTHFSRHKVDLERPPSRIPRLQVKERGQHSKRIYICSFKNTHRGKLIVYYLNQDEALYERLKEFETRNQSVVETLPNPMTFRVGRGPLVFENLPNRKHVSESKVMEEVYTYCDFPLGNGSVTVDVFQENHPGDRICISTLPPAYGAVENAHQGGLPGSPPWRSRLCTQREPQESTDHSLLSPSSDYSTLQLPNRLAMEGCDCRGACSLSCQANQSVENAVTRDLYQPLSLDTRDLYRGERARCSTSSGRTLSSGYMSQFSTLSAGRRTPAFHHSERDGAYSIPMPALSSGQASRGAASISAESVDGTEDHSSVPPLSVSEALRSLYIDQQSRHPTDAQDSEHGDQSEEEEEGES